MEQERRCGAQTLQGTQCKRPVHGTRERCYFHTGPQCAVCLGSITPQMHRRLGCGHEFHTRCLERWKHSCPGDPTCPECRAPFDVPAYRCRLIIERVSDGTRVAANFDSSNIATIVEGFGVDFRQMFSHGGRLYTDIQFDIEPGEVLQDILRELNLPDVRFD